MAHHNTNSDEQSCTKCLANSTANPVKLFPGACVLCVCTVQRQKHDQSKTIGYVHTLKASLCDFMATSLNHLQQ